MASFLRPVRMMFPPIFESGSGAVSKVGEWAEAEGKRKPLVVADAFNGSRVDLLGLSGDVTVFDGVTGEPDRACLDAALALAREAKPDLVVGFGGGSAMDLAKLVAVLHDGTQSLDEVVGPNKVAGRNCALIQVPTTAGTGSEGGPRSLVTDIEKHVKLAVESRHMLADLAVVDPELTITVPSAVTAATGIDALAHCVESFTNKKAHPAVDLYAREGIRLIGRYLPRAVDDGTDIEARMGMLMASFYGGLCLGPVNTAGGHAVSYPLGTRCGLPHGLANALVFPHVLAFNAPTCPEKTAEILDLLGRPAGAAPTAEDTFRQAEDFCRDIGIEPASALPPLTDAELRTMAEEAFAIKRLLDNNPREIAQDDILAMYRRMTGGR